MIQILLSKPVLVDVLDTFSDLKFWKRMKTLNMAAKLQMHHEET